MARRSLFLPAVLTAVGLVLADVATVGAQSADRPNVLLIVTDDQRPGTLGVMPRVRRWFRRQGTEFSNAYATTPLCCPSRASILTGQYLHNHGIIGNRMDPQALVDVQPRMVQAAFDTAGYRTGLFGKFLNGWPNDLDPMSFDRWSTTPYMSYSGAEWNTNGTTDTVEQNSTSYIGSQAVEFIDEAELEEDVPWFTIVGFMAPHLPAIVEPAYDDAAVPPFHLTPAMRERDRRDKPAYVARQRPPSLDDLRSIRTRQLRSLVAVDDQIGRIMRRMSDLDELDDTLAIFVSDNGFLWGDHGLIGKSVPYDASIRVPLLARWPGHVHAGALDNRLVGMVDLAPTMMAAAQLSTPVKADGMNLLNAAASRHRLLIEFRRILPRHVPSWNAFLTHRFIFVSHRARVDGLVEREYYDMRTDPHQLHNLLGDKIRGNDPDVRRMMQRLRRLTTCAGRTCPR